MRKLGSELLFPTREVQLLPGTSGGHYNKEKYRYWKRFLRFLFDYLLSKGSFGFFVCVTACACVKSDQLMEVF